MRSLLLPIALLLASPAWAAWTAVGTIANANDGTAGSTWAPTTSAALDAGNVGVCVLAKDETGTGTTDGTGQVTSLVDAAGNTWTEGGDWCNMQTSTAANGACVAIYWTRAGATLSSGAAMTWTFAASTTGKAVTCMEYTTTTSDIVIVARAAGDNGLANDAADPGSMTDATTVSRAHLFVRGSSCESNNTGYTADTDYTAFTGQGASSTSDSGTAATSIGSRGEYRVATQSTSAASDPTYVAADCASYVLALDEDPCTGLCIDSGFPKTTFKSNTTGATITSPSFIVGGSTRTLVLVYTLYTTGADPWPITCAWSGGTPGPATAWVLRAWNAIDNGNNDNPNPTYSFTGDSTSGNDQEDLFNRHHTARIWTSTWSGTPSSASAICTRTGTDANTGIVSIYSFGGAQTTFGTLGQHHSSGTEIADLTAQTINLPITASASGSFLIGGLYWGNAGGAVTANGSTTIDFQADDGGSQGVSVAFRLTGTTTASTGYTLGVTDSQWAWGVAAIEVLASSAPPSCALSIALMGVGCR